MLPGPELAVTLGRVNPARLTGNDAIIYLQARHRQSSYEEVMELLAVVEVAFCAEAGSAERTEKVAEWAEDEIRLALGWSITRARNRLAYGIALRDRLPDVLDEQRAGRIDGVRTWAFMDNVLDLPQEHIDEIVRRLLPKAPELTAGELVKRIVRREALLVREEVKDLLPRPVVAGRVKLGAA